MAKKEPILFDRVMVTLSGAKQYGTVTKIVGVHALVLMAAASIDTGEYWFPMDEIKVVEHEDLSVLLGANDD